MEELLEFFSIFGGVEWDSIDTSKPIMQLIEELILQDYAYIRNDVSEITSGSPTYHAILTGIALGDGKLSSAFKRANVPQEVGAKAVEELCELGLIKVEKPKKVFTSWADAYPIPNKLIFTSPFLRFWFAFVSPLFQGIKEGNFKEVQERFTNRQQEFVHPIFVQLSHELLKQNVQDDPIVEVGSYWDKEIEIDIFAKTASGKTVVGSCKYTNAKVKKSELSALEEKCSQAKIDADIFVLVSKKGFSNELKSLKSDTLKLLSVKSFKNLLVNSNKI